MLPERIRSARKRWRLSQKQLGEMLGVTASAVGMWEQGKRRPNAGLLAHIAIRLGVSLDYLLGLAEEHPAVSGDRSTYPLVAGHCKGQALRETRPSFCGAWAQIADNGSVFRMTVQDDSMLFARIHQGDVVTLRTHDSVRSGEIAALWEHGRIILRRAHKIGDRWLLLAEGPEHKPAIVSSDDLQIVGRVERVEFEP